MKQTVTSTDILGKTYSVSVKELSWRPAVYAIIVKDNQLLLVKERGQFHLPGGGLDLGEKPEDGVKREAREETGLIVDNPRLVGNLSTFFTYARHENWADLAHVQSLLLYYRCDLVGGELSTDGLEADEKAHDLRPEWVPIADLPTIAVGSTVDWRPLVQAAPKRQA
ncbi:MAG TPA: NUDIX domain-containing protein [Candidatus Saccharimonadales bacterium]|nr:NUDIX domain-containing protein [Candidatus Saccharimonadales bacterium]